MQTAIHPRDRFRGNWSLYRHIFDLDSQWLGKFEGHAELSDSEYGLDYFEEGYLQFGGLHAIQATRRYLWSFPSDQRVDVAFEDGKAFHHFLPDEPRTEATHFCDPDTYDATYDFTNWPIWRVEWRVEGPKKDYRMVSVYAPIVAKAAPKPVLDKLLNIFG